MPNITMTFSFLNAANQPVAWTPANQAVIVNLGLSKLNFENPMSIVGQRNNVTFETDCKGWTSQFNVLDASFEIFSDAAGTNAVGRNAPPCIGSLIAADAVTLYLKSKLVPAAIESAIAAAAAAPGVVTALATPAQITTYLQNQAYIRVYIPASGGRGHQSTTCLIVRRLIVLGYRGAFEVIYVNNNNNADKIRILLPELSLQLDPGNPQDIAPPVPPATFFSSPALGNCAFTFTTQAAGPLPPLRQFGISGGVDDPSVNPKPICNVSYFLMLQPFQWNAANYMYVNGAASPAAPNPIDLGRKDLLGNLKFLGTSCYLTDIMAYSWATVSLEIARMPTPAQPVVTGIQANCVANPNYPLLPVYGLANAEGGAKVMHNWPNITQISALANLVLAVLEGQANASLNRATVIMTLDSYEPTWNNDLLQLLPAPYHARISFYMDGAVWSNTAITNLTATQILIVNLPSILPVPLFNYFYLNSSLPPIFEGKGTMPIMLNSGRPYLQLSKQANGFDTINATAPPPPAPTVTRLKVFLYPWVPYVYGPGIIARSETTHGEGSQNIQTCFEAGKAIVWNTQESVTINADTFNVDATKFDKIKDYLKKHFYIDTKNRIQNKFKALLNAAEFENSVPEAITKEQMYNDMQTACGAGAANVCTIYRNNIALLTTFFSDSITRATGLPAYFTGLGTYFNNPANDKLLQGLGFAVAAINAGL